VNRFSQTLAAHSLLLRHTRTEVLQVNVGKLCNLTCAHCHVNAGPKRKEIMTRETIDRVIEWFARSEISTLDITGALQSFRKKLTLDEQAIAADPANVQASDDLGYSNLRIGDLLESSGEDKEALPYYGRALEKYERNAAADPQDLALRFRIASIRAQLGKAQAKTGSVASAREDCTKARELLQTITEDHDDVSLRRLRLEACISLGDAYSAVAAVDTNAAATHRRSACDTYQRSFEIMQEMRSGRVPAADEITEMEELAGKVAECDKVPQ
jgi:tetratricopeptide (TPR) repeat protein